MSTGFTRRQLLLGGVSGAAVLGLATACGDDGGSGGEPGTGEGEG